MGFAALNQSYMGEDGEPKHTQKGASRGQGLGVVRPSSATVSAGTSGDFASPASALPDSFHKFRSMRIL
jgi:hypothetical protein